MEELSASITYTIKISDKASQKFEIKVYIGIS